MAVSGSPTVRRWELGARLKQLRMDAGLTANDVAERLLTSTTKISRLETGDRPPQLRDVRDLCDLYEVNETQRNQLMELARGARERGWWQSYDLIAGSNTYAGLEASAVSIQNWEPLLVPGLFQTAAYAEAVLKAFIPTYSSDPVNPNDYVSARAERQKRLLNPEGPDIWAVVHEGALRTLVGGRSVMRKQWEHLLVLAQDPKITLQYLAFETGAHPGVQGPFVVLEFEPAVVSDVVFSEGLAGQYFFEKPEELKRYRKAFNRLRADAESTERTQRFIEGLVGDR